MILVRQSFARRNARVAQRATATPFCPNSGNNFLSADLVEHTAQLVEVHGLDQVKIKSRLLAAADVFLRAKSSERYCLNRLFSFGFRDHIVSTAIGKANVAQDHIEFLRLHDFQRALRIIRDRNLVTKMSE